MPIVYTNSFACLPISVALRYVTFIDFDASQVRGFNDTLDEIDANYRRTLQNIGGEQHVRSVLPDSRGSGGASVGRMVHAYTATVPFP